MTITKSTENRLVKNATTIHDACWYLIGRARQLLHTEWRLVGDFVNFENKAVIASMEHPREGTHQVIYILDQYTGCGLYKEIYKHYEYPIVTVNDCDMESYFKHKGISYTVAKSPILDGIAYCLITEKYKDLKGNRSGVPLMNHIDEGLYILSKISADKETMEAYILHPLFQMDEDLFETMNKDSAFLYNLKMLGPKVITYAMEYRNVANDYLSFRKINSINEIKLSKLNEVNQMLIADKVQNYKDFCIYHKESHPRSKELEQYFNNWFQRLGLDNELVNLWIKELSLLTLDK
jgi:hypothetical protein